MRKTEQKYADDVDDKIDEQFAVIELEDSECHEEERNMGSIIDDMSQNISSNVTIVDDLITQSERNSQESAAKVVQSSLPEVSHSEPSFFCHY